MIEEVLNEEQKRYLESHPETRGNGYYTRSLRSILGEYEV